MSVTEPRAAPVALLSAALVLLTTPLALGLLQLVLTDSTGVAELINLGGVFSYVVLISGVLGGLAAALVAGLAVRRGTIPLSLAAVPMLLPLGAAALGVRDGSLAVQAALVRAHPLDRGMIAALSVSELTSLPSLALPFATSVAFALALASLLQGSRPLRAASATVFLALTGSLGARLVATRRLGEGLARLTHTTPAPRAELIAGVAGEVRPPLDLSFALFVASLLAVCLTVSLT